MSEITIRPHFDSNGKDFAIERSQDCTDIIDWNAESRTQEQRSDWGRHKARIPNVVLLKWLDEAHRNGQRIKYMSEEFNQLVDKKLNDPDYFYLRTDRPALQVGWN